MKKLFLFLALWPLFTFSQDWHPFPENQTAYFASIPPTDSPLKYKDIKTIKIDSVVVNQTMQNYFNLYSPTFIYTDGEYSYSDPYSSWIGKYVKKYNYNPVVFTDNNATEYQFDFISYNMEPELCCEIEDVGYLFTKLDSIKYDEVVEGIMDSLKYYSFQLYEGWMTNPIDHSINNKQIIISKNFGLVQIFQFGGLTSLHLVKEKRLIGLDINNDTYGFEWDFDEMIGNYEVGNEYHLTNGFDYDLYYLEDMETIGNTVTLNYLRCLDDSSGTIYNKTRKHYLDYYPGQSIIEDQKGYIGMSLYKDEVYGRRTWLQRYRLNKTEGYYNNQFVWISEVIHTNYGIVPPYIHADKAGIYETWYNTNQERYEMFYFRTPDESWGEPYNFICDVGIDENFQNEYSISPNPSNGIFSIQISKKIEELKVYSINGQIVWQVDELNKTQIDLSTLPVGLYLLELKTENQELIHQKVVIKK